MSVAEKRHSAFEMQAERTFALQHAASLVGQAVLAAGMGIPERTVRSYLSVERGQPAIAVRLAAQALRLRAAELLAHADKLDGLA